MNSLTAPDFLIISALADETAAVMSRLHHHREVEHEHGRVFFASLWADGAGPSCVVLPMKAPGRLAAALVSARAMLLWQPKAAVLVGIAGAFQHAGVAHGDVLVATEILDYEQQKISGSHAEVRWQVFEASTELLAVASLTSKTEWWGDLSHQPAVHFGPMLSGEKLVASSVFAHQLLSWRSDALGVEMEGAGVGAAVSFSPTEFLMVRGVADFADESKSDTFRTFACEAAAQFAIAALRRLSESAGERR